MKISMQSTVLLIFLFFQVTTKIVASDSGAGHGHPAPSEHQVSSASKTPSIPGTKKHGEKCTENSQECDKNLRLECKADGKCHCGVGFSSSMNKTCLLSHGENCSGSIPCNADRFLKCSNISLKCECKLPAEQVFDEKTMFCRSKVGSTHCNHTETTWSLHCVKDAYCSSVVTDSHSKHECKCKHGFVEQKSKLCSAASTATKPFISATISISTTVYSFLVLAINH